MVSRFEWHSVAISPYFLSIVLLFLEKVSF